jgi:SH3 domain protein
MNYISRTWLIGLIVLNLAGTAAAESNWVIDSFEVTLRTGPSTDNTIVRMLTSGTELEVLSRDAAAGYTQVRTASGAEGWVLTRYLMAEPSAREQLAALTSRLTNATEEGSSLSGQLEAVRAEYDSATRTISSLEQDKAALEQQLADIRRTSANVLAIDEQNKVLREQLAEAEITVGTLEQHNRELTSQANRYWFITGAVVLVVGIILGVWLPRVRWQRRSRYDRF